MIYIEPGHFGDEEGAIVEGFREKNFNLQIAEMVCHLLKHRYEVDYFLGNEKNKIERVKQANKLKAKAFISIHCNAYSAKDDNGNKITFTEANGIETIFHANSYKGRCLAKCLQNSLIEETKRTDRGFKVDYRNLYILKKTIMPAAIVECGFMTNITELHLLKKREYRFLLAEGICRGIVKYLNKKERCYSFD